MSKLKVYTISLGCPKNLVDTEKILGSIGDICAPISELKMADIVLINTCSFIKDAVEEAIDTILETIEEIKTLDNKPKLIVTGCLVNRYYEELTKEIPEVDLFLEIEKQHKLRDIIARDILKKQNSYKRFISTPPSYAYLKIAEGCNHRCSFCTIPSIRGGLKSFSENSIIDEARYILSTGRKEIVLVAQDVTSYGMDLGDRKKLFNILGRLSKLQGLSWLRLLYLYPKGITRDFLKFLKDITPPFIPYFDVPLQHVCPEILKKMGRPFQVPAEKIIDLIREFFPDAAIRTSFIVGFPGEKDRDFEQLVNFVKNVRFTHVGVFSYSNEEGTLSSKYPDQVPEEIKEQRKQIIMEEQKSVSRDFLKTFKGKKLKILIDKKSDEWPTLYEGRPWFFAPEIDGLTYVSGEGVQPGDMVDVVIQETYDYDLSGII